MKTHGPRGPTDVSLLMQHWAVVCGELHEAFVVEERDQKRRSRKCWLFSDYRRNSDGSNDVRAILVNEMRDGNIDWSRRRISRVDMNALDPSIKMRTGRERPWCVVPGRPHLFPEDVSHSAD
jgi:hypothetical protein